MVLVKMNVEDRGLGFFVGLQIGIRRGLVRCWVDAESSAGGLKVQKDREFGLRTDISNIENANINFSSYEIKEAMV